MTKPKAHLMLVVSCLISTTTGAEKGSGSDYITPYSVLERIHKNVGPSGNQKLGDNGSNNRGKHAVDDKLSTGGIDSPPRMFGNGEGEWYDDYDYDLDADEMMKTSPQIVFRPLFRHRQMMEDKKKRADERKKILEEQRRLSDSGAKQIVGGSNYFFHYDQNNDIFLCSKEHCRPATAYDVTAIQQSQVHPQKKVVSANNNHYPNYYYYPDTPVGLPLKRRGD